MRHDGRTHDQLRPIRIEPDFMPNAEGSVLYVQGSTRVICAASVEESVPGFLRGKGRGWVTAEYRMLPRATDTRTSREPDRGQLSGRTQEIQRLIGRALRAVVDFEALGERTIIVDCDVIQADGGTRTASITGAYVALALAIRNLTSREILAASPITGAVAAVSVGIVDGEPTLDLDYSEDSRAEVDVNIAMTDAGKYVEIQGTAEGQPFDRRQTDELLTLAERGIVSLLVAQRDALGR
jgi:ribonuclease PH